VSNAKTVATTATRKHEESLRQALRELIKRGLHFGDAVNVFAESRTAAELRYVEKANDKARDGELEVDPSAIVSISEDGGAYVMAWVWVYANEDSESNSSEE
jgi:hypothetical protein